MIQLVDHMLIINLEGLAMMLRANMVEIGCLVLICVLYVLGGKYVPGLSHGQNNAKAKKSQGRSK
jgi:hypothetical protein